MVGMYAVNGGLEVRTPYDPDFVQDLKRLPASDRRYDPNRKIWVVTPDHGQEVADMLLRHFGFHVQVPSVAVQARVETRVLDIRYIGGAKDRGNGAERTAYGWCDGGWNAIFTELVLKDWFGQVSRPDEALTLYAVLTVKPASTVDEIKTAYRRLAKQWHPDVAKEPNAAEQFRSIQHAYEILRDEKMRARYDVGLKMSKQTDVVASGRGDIEDYRSPLRCGLILADGTNKLGKFNVTRIQAWEDIVNSRGQTLVTSWKLGDETYSENWV